MLKNKPLIIALFFLCFCFNAPSFAVENIKPACKYPDYSCEFCGQDRCEKFNRKLFNFNLKLNRYVLRPVNIAWASIMPKCAMDRLQNMYTNINFPVRGMSCLLQKDFKAAKQEASRFFINTTIGLAGMYDPAKNKFKLEPRNEDMEQALFRWKVKNGPYLVLPVVRGNVRTLAGMILDYPLKPLSYIPIAGGIATAVFNINNTTCLQPLFKKVDDNYADPYELAREYDGLDRFIKHENLDRREVLAAKTATQNIIKVSNTIINPNLKPDIFLKNYNSQGAVIDSMRTSFFDDPNLNKSAWSELSLWNRNFNKQIKTASVKLDNKCMPYKYKYILQKNKTSPVLVIYPSTGEGVNSYHSIVIAKMFYDKGYSVIIQGSSFQWEFAKCMPKNYKPGLPDSDAQYLRQITSKVFSDLESKKGYKFEKKVVLGTSLGGLTALFIGAQEQQENKLGISKYICISPPIKLFYALGQIDKFSQDWKNGTSDIKERVAVTSQKIIQISQNESERKNMVKSENMPFTDDEAKLVVGFIMKQKLSDLVFTVENCSRCKKNDKRELINDMSFSDYAQKYFLSEGTKTYEQIDYESSMHSISDFLQKNNNYKIYEAVDDYYVNPDQLCWLKDKCGNKATFLNNGSHLGYLYRQEFISQLKRDVSEDVTSDEHTLLRDKTPIEEEVMQDDEVPFGL